jgi:DtxR family Mn-dependent transcriptional regulator
MTNPSLTAVEENYLKYLYLLSQSSPDGVVKTNDIAYKLDHSAASVTDMLQKLAGKKLVKYEKYRGSSLSKTGLQIALRVLRKHRLWELFLNKVLHFTWDKVHDIAEQLEHVQSDELIERIDEYLSYPKFDPHGDPIPDAKGNILFSGAITLSDARVNTWYQFSGVNNHTTTFMNYLNKLDLSLQDQIRIVEKEEFDQALIVQKKQGGPVPVSHEAARCMLVQPTSK